jgi:hypothetical protein
MQRTEAQFCRDEAARLLNLAQATTDPKVREDLRKMAGEWVERAKVREVSETKVA